MTKELAGIAWNPKKYEFHYGRLFLHAGGKISFDRRLYWREHL